MQHAIQNPGRKDRAHLRRDIVDRLHAFPDVESAFRRRKNNRHVVHEEQGLQQRIAIPLLRHLSGKIPLVDQQHAAFVIFHDHRGNFLVLLGRPLLRVQHQYDDVRALDALLGPKQAEPFDGLVHPAHLAHAGRVDQEIVRRRLPLPDRERHLDAVARRPRNLGNDHALAAKQAVDVRGFPYVRPADHHDLERFAFGGRRPRRKPRNHGRHQRIDPAVVRRRNRVDRKTQPFEVVRGPVEPFRVRLVGRHNDLAPGAVQEPGNLLVQRRNARRQVGDENNHGGIRERGLHLLANARGNRIGRLRVIDHREAAGVDQLEHRSLPVRPARDPVARDAALFVHDRHALADDAVEQRGLADIGPAHDRDNTL